MKEAYQQLELSQNCRYVTNFHAEKGIRRLKRVHCGITNSLEIFQKAIHQSLGNLYLMISLFTQEISRAYYYNQEVF